MQELCETIVLDSAPRDIIRIEKGVIPKLQEAVFFQESHGVAAGNIDL
jgi:hypothetical protein